MTDREWEHNRRQHELWCKKLNPYPTFNEIAGVDLTLRKESNVAERRGEARCRWGKKFALTAQVRGKEAGPGSFRLRTGIVVGYEPGSQYAVRFDDTGRIEYVSACWFEAA